MITRTIKDKKIEFIADFEADIFDKFITLMSKIFVEKEKDFIHETWKFSELYKEHKGLGHAFSHCLYLDMDFPMYMVTIFNNIYELYNLPNRNLKISYFILDNVLVLTYNKNSESKDREKIVIENALNCKLDDKSFAGDSGELSYDNNSNTFVDKSNIIKNLIGKYNICYYNLFIDEIDIIDYIISLLKNNKDNPSNINCINVLKYIIKDYNNIKDGRVEENRVIIENDTYKLDIYSDNKEFYICYNRLNYNNHKTNKLARSELTIRYNYNSYVNEMYYKFINHLSIVLFDFIDKNSSTIDYIRNESYDLDKIENS